ncbi:MAG: HYR domain-containing protein [Chloroflexi bacterium]|nr:MAG: HYR domain-containing protein [Chloroflexota bacterium]
MHSRKVRLDGSAFHGLEKVRDRSLGWRGILYGVVLGASFALPATPAAAGSPPGPITLSMSCTGPGPNGSVAAGQTDSCGVDLTGGTLLAGSFIRLSSPSPAATSFTCSPPMQGAQGCTFSVNSTLTYHGFIGWETIQFAPDGPTQGGGASLTQTAQACNPVCNYVPLRIDGPGSVVGTPYRPRYMPAAPFAYMVCTGPNPDGTVSETQVDTCLIYTAGFGGPYINGDTLTVARRAPTDATVTACGDSPSTDTGAVPVGDRMTSCAYRFSTPASISAPGVFVGTELLSIPSTVVPGAAIVQDVTFCPAPQPAGQIASCSTLPIAITGAGATVIDEIPPTFTSMPPDMTVDATGPADTIVQYPDPTATDNAPGAVSISCTPASGSMFAVGTTAVVCTATDVSGNSATASFNVTAQNTFDSLCRVTQAEASNEGVAHSLCVKLQGAADAVAAGDPAAADGKLGAYINEVEAQSDKSLTSQQAQDLAGLAQLLMP